MKRAIVTGATGFIGSWLVLELLKNEYEVVVVARDKNRLIPEIAERCKVVEKSLLDLRATDFECKNVDTFFHLAWEGVTSEKKNQLDIQLNNIKMSLNAIEVAHDILCKRVVAAGTVAEYALCDDVMNMKDRPTPNDYYGAAKVSAYYFCEVRARQLKQPFIWCIVPSTYGERRTDGNIISYTIKSLLNGEIPTYGNLNQMWDFLYVKDTVRAIRLIGEKGKPDKVYGIGSGEYKTLREYVYAIRDLINPKLSLGIGEDVQQSEHSFSSCVNNYDLKKDTGFRAEYSFEEGMARTIEYYKKI